MDIFLCRADSCEEEFGNEFQVRTVGRQVEMRSEESEHTPRREFLVVVGRIYLDD